MSGHGGLTVCVLHSLLMLLPHHSGSLHVLLLPNEAKNPPPHPMQTTQPLHPMQTTQPLHPMQTTQPPHPMPASFFPCEQVTPYRAGHVLGAAMFMVDIAGMRCLYTGDYSRIPDRHLPAADIPPVKPHIGD